MTNLSEIVTTQILAAIPRAGARRPPQLELSLSSAPTCNHFMTVRSYMKVFVSPPRTLSPGSSARARCSSQVEAIPARIISRRWRCTAGDAPDLNGSSGDDLSGVAPGGFRCPTAAARQTLCRTFHAPRLRSWCCPWRNGDSVPMATVATRQAVAAGHFLPECEFRSTALDHLRPWRMRFGGFAPSVNVRPPLWSQGSAHLLVIANAIRKGRQECGSHREPTHFDVCADPG
jgi:hypothetical protein